MKQFKIQLSKDNKTATIYFYRLNKSIRLYDSYGPVMLLVQDFLFTPIGKGG